MTNSEGPPLDTVQALAEARRGIALLDRLVGDLQADVDRARQQRDESMGQLETLREELTQAGADYHRLRKDRDAVQRKLNAAQDELIAAQAGEAKWREAYTRVASAVPGGEQQEPTQTHPVGVPYDVSSGVKVNITADGKWFVCYIEQQVSLYYHARLSHAERVASWRRDSLFEPDMINSALGAVHDADGGKFTGRSALLSWREKLLVAFWAGCFYAEIRRESR